MVHLESMEVTGVYLLLKKYEKELDSTLLSLFNRIESTLYEKLSIEELESLNKLYAEKIDVLAQRGYF